MKERIISYENLRITTYDFDHIEKFTIENKVNNHGVLKIQGLISDEVKDDYLHYTFEETPIMAYYITGEDEETLLFDGLVTNLKVKCINNEYVMNIEAKSSTYGMDLYKMQRTFQNKKMTTHELIDEVMLYYPQINYEINIPNEAIKDFILQYRETDWEFLKRVISKYNATLISSMDSDNIQLYIGTPEVKQEVSREIDKYKIVKNLEAFSVEAKNFNDDVFEEDYVSYIINTQEHYSIGSNLTILGKTLYIKSVYHELKGSLLENTYELVAKRGIRTNRLYNDEIVGVSITGNIAKVKRDRVKIQLEIEYEKELEELCYFSYASVAASPDGGGWYCMPEVGERIRLYLPTRDEKEAFVVNSIDTHDADEPSEEDRMSNPDNKSLKTDYGQEIKFTPTGVIIEATGSKGSMKLNSDGSVTLTGEKTINIASSKSVSIRAEEALSINAKKTIDILCESGGSLLIDESDNIDVKGNRILNNG